MLLNILQHTGQPLPQRRTQSKRSATPRLRDWLSPTHLIKIWCVCVCVCVYIYIYAHIIGGTLMEFKTSFLKVLIVVIIVFVQSLCRIQLSATPWTIAHQAPLSSTISRSLLKFTSIELAVLSNHLILCRPLLLLPSVCPSITVFSSELALRIRWPKY